MRLTSLCLVAALAAACGGDDENLADPRLIGGGGIGDGAIAGRVNIYVIDEVTDEPVANADVFVGEPGEEPITGTTDSSGLFTADSGSLKGPTTVTAVADGYVPATWFGGNGVNMTIPLSPTSSGAIPQASLAGTITGWDGLPDPDTNHFVVGIVTYSQNNQLGDAANDLPQPTGTGGLPGNACVKSALLTQCDWEVNSRTGNVALFAIIVDIDTKGNGDDSDDTSEIIGFAHKTGLTVEAGVGQTGLALTMVDVSAIVDVTVESETPPAAVDSNLGIIMGLDLGDDGIAMVGLLQDGSTDAVTLPDLTGPFADATYQAIAFAAAGEDDADPSTGIIKRGITDLDATVVMGDWMDLPSSLAENAGQYSFEPVAGATLHSVDFDGSSGTVWNTVMLDGRTTFTLPGLDPDPLPSGDHDMVVTAVEGDFAVDDFQLNTAGDIITRVSDNRITVSQ